MITKELVEQIDKTYQPDLRKLLKESLNTILAQNLEIKRSEKALEQAQIKLITQGS